MFILGYYITLQLYVFKVVAFKNKLSNNFTKFGKIKSNKH